MRRRSFEATAVFEALGWPLAGSGRDSKEDLKAEALLPMTVGHEQDVSVVQTDDPGPTWRRGLREETTVEQE